MDKHTGGVSIGLVDREQLPTLTIVWCQQTTTMYNHNQRQWKKEARLRLPQIPREKRTVKDKFVKGNYTLSQYVIHIIFEFRWNTTFDKN